MKLYKSLFLAAIAAVGTLVSSCSEDGVYETYKGGASGAPVTYSFNNKVANYTYMPDDSIEDVKVTVTRNKTDIAYTLPLKVKVSDASLVVVGDSVVFAAGVNTAELNIHLTRDLNMGESAVVELSIDPGEYGIPVVEKPSELDENADSAAQAEYNKALAAYNEYTTKMADYKMTTTVTMMRDYSWTAVGTATFRDDALATIYGMDPCVAEAEMDKCDQVEGYYRLVNPYGAKFPLNEKGMYDADNTYYLYIHAEDPDFVYILPQSTGATWNSGDGTFWLADFAGYYIAKGNSPELVKSKGYGGKLADGVITWATKGMICGFNGDMGYYANTNGLYYIAMPGVKVKSYSAEVTYKGVFVDKSGKTEVVGSLALDGDASEAYVTVRAKGDDASAVADAILTGNLEAEKFKSGDFQIPFDAAELGSDLQIVAVVVDEDAVQAIATCNFEYSAGGSKWVSMGMGQYTDDIVTTAYFKDAKPVTYEVEVFQNPEKPGIYRIMDPYALGVYPYAQAFKESGLTIPNKGEKYLEVNAEDPEGVYIQNQELGVDDNFSFETIGASYLTQYDFSTVKQAGYLGELKEGVITFPAFYTDNTKTTVFQGYMNVGSSSYYACTSAALQLVLPGYTAPASVKKYAKKQGHVSLAPFKAKKCNSKRMPLLHTEYLVK